MDAKRVFQSKTFLEDCDDGIVEVTFEGQKLLVDKRDASMIINNDCKRIMRNLCNAQAAGRGNFQSGSTEVTQPSFLSCDDRILFFKTKMFYLLQERHCFLQHCKKSTHSGTKKVHAVAEAYPSFLSPFCESVFDMEPPSGFDLKKRRGGKNTDLLRSMPDGTKLVTSKLDAIYKSRSKMVQNPQKTGMARFVDNLRKADQSVLHMLEEKVLKTMEGAGFATLLSDRDVKRGDVIFSLFPDYNLLVDDGKDEESKLNNLVNHVRTRIKYFERLQLFYENPNHEDHMAHVFTVPNMEAVEVREELVSLKPKRMHLLDEKKMQKLYSIFKDDYSSAKTTLIADGTQPVVLNRKKLDRVKKYVEDCAEWKGTMLVPYVRETNFFFLTIPWIRLHDNTRKYNSETITG